MHKLSALPLLALPLASVSAAPAPQRAAAVAAAPGANASAPARSCAPPSVTYALAGPGAQRARKLGEQPPANHYLAVDRRIDGCPEPAVVRTGISG